MEELSDRFRWKVLTHLLPQSPRAWTERTALPPTARDWLLMSISTPSFNSLKKSQVKGRHFHTFFFPEIPQILHNLGVGFGVLACCPCSVTPQVREDCWLTALLLWFH